MSTIQREHTTRSIEALVGEIGVRIAVPIHQREYCWTEARQKKLIASLLRGMPMPTIVIRRKMTATDIEDTLEDGVQRLMTLRRFLQGEFTENNGLHFEELTERAKVLLTTYQTPVLIYSGATDAEAIEIFNNFQNGVPLSTGERLYSMSTLSPLVRYAKAMLMTPGAGLHDRASEFFGAQTGTDSRRKNLLSAVALIAGLGFGIGLLSKKWGDLESIIASQFDEAAVTRKLNDILDIYRRVTEAAPRGGKALKTFQANWGNGVGYIAYCLSLQDESLPPEMRQGVDRLKDAWVLKLVEYRDSTSLKEVLARDGSKARSWNTARWQQGMMNLFPNMPAQNVAAALDTDSESDDE